MKKLVENGEKSKVDEIIAGLHEKETINKDNRFSFVNEIIKWIKIKDNLEDSNYILLNQAIYKSWMNYYEKIVNDENYELYGKEAIKYVLNCLIKEKDSKIINNIIEYLIDKKIVEKYKNEINESGLSEKDQNYLLSKIKEREKKIYDEEKSIDELKDKINSKDND